MTHQKAPPMPNVLNKHVSEIPEDAVYVGRGSKWGNPFPITRDHTRADVLAMHEAWLKTQHDLLRAIHELRGKYLVCFCAPQPCHADLLLRLANGTRQDMIEWWRGPTEG